MKDAKREIFKKLVLYILRNIAQGLVILEPSQILSMDKVIVDDKDEVKID